MLRALAWKEYREHRAVWLAMACLTVMVIVALLQLLQPAGAVTASKAWVVLIAGMVMAGTYGLVCGSMMLAGEREAGTLTFLDALTGRRGGLWGSKLALGAMLTLLQGTFVTAFLLVLLPMQPAWEWARDMPAEGIGLGEKSVLFIGPVLIGLEAFVWGLLFSALRKDVLSAAAMAALPLGALGVTSVAPLSPPLIGFRLLVTAGALWASWQVFCRHDAARMPGMAALAGWIELFRTVLAAQPRSVHAAIGGLAALTFLLANALYPRDISSVTSSEMAALFLMPMLWAAIFGLVSGSMLFDWRQPSKVRMSGRCGRQPLACWLAHILVGLVFTALGLLLLTILLVSFAPLRVPDPTDVFMNQLASVYFLPLVLLAFKGLGWGLFFSAAFRRFAPAFVVSLTILCLESLFTFCIEIVFLWPAPGGPRDLLLLHALFPLLALFGSGVIVYCRYAQRPQALAETEVPEHVAIQSSSSWRQLLWLICRQAWVAAIVMAVAGIVASFFIPSSAWIVWPVFTMVLGVACGIGVFAGEQATGSHVFLGNQRLPLGWVWLVKSSLWLALAAGVASITLVGGAIGIAATKEGWEAMERYLSHRQDVTLFEGSLSWVINPWLAVTMWLIYGFSFGQFFALVFRKSAVAAVAAVIVSAMVLTFWLPSFICGGLKAWQVFGAPVFLLAAVRLVLWAWASGRLYAWRPGAVLVGCGLLSVVWIGGNLWYRVLEVPGGSEEPFDVQAYEASFPKPEENEAGQLIHAAFRDLEALRKAADEAMKPPSRPGEGSRPGASYYDHLADIHDKGWAAASPELDRWLNRMFHGNWHRDLREAAALPPGVVDDPRHVSWVSLLRSPGSHQAASLLTARALQLQARGDHEAALEHLVVTLALSRHVRNRGILICQLIGEALETAALRGLDRWLTDLGPRPELLRRARDELNRHEAEVPRGSDNIKAEYLVYRNSWESMPSLLSRFQDPLLGELLSVAWQVPWEKERRGRLMNAVFAEEVQLANAPYWQIADQLDRWEERYFDKTRTSPLGRLLNESWGRLHYPITSRARLSMTATQCRVRAARLKVALMLYQVEKSQAAETLEELVAAHYLDGVPTDPFSGQPFRYRVSQGEEMGVYESPVRLDAALALVAPGQGILWSTGPDMIDNGGKMQGERIPLGRKEWLNHRPDLIFLVPPVKPQAKK